MIGSRSWPRLAATKTERTRVSQRPRLRFTPYAWAKLVFLRDLGPTEIGGFGICDPDDLLLVTDFVTVRQRCTSASVVFEDAAVTRFFSDQAMAGRPPESFDRVWIHTHPGNSARPSSTDERTFRRCFGQANWAVMCIVAEGGATYARYRSNAGPGMHRRLDVAVEYGVDFEASNQDAWKDEYHERVTVHDPFLGEPRFGKLSAMEVGDIAG